MTNLAETTVPPVRSDLPAPREWLELTVAKWRWLLFFSLIGGTLAYAASFMVPPTYSAKMTFLSPQAQQGMAATTLASISGLAGLTGSGGTKGSADQYVALMQSRTVLDRLAQRFKLTERYDVEFEEDARRELANRSFIVAGRKDGLISVEVLDQSAEVAADIANAYFEEIRAFSNSLALTEAQQRRQFFEVKLAATRKSLDAAQAVLQASGFSAGALKSEPRSAAEGYARAKADLATAMVQLNALRQSMTDLAPAVMQQLGAVRQLQSQLARLESPAELKSSEDFVGSYRDFKYQEALFDAYAKQLEVARLDESKDAALFQMVDAAVPPERRAKPRRTFWAIGGLLLGFGLGLAWAYWLSLRRSKSAPL